MPRYIEQLTENITPASGDWLWIVDVSALATDQDRKLSVGKLALLATANVFTANQRVNALVGVNVAPTTGQQLTVKAASASTVGLVVDTAASPTAAIQSWKVNGTEKAAISPEGYVKLLSHFFQPIAVSVITPGGTLLLGITQGTFFVRAWNLTNASYYNTAIVALAYDGTNGSALAIFGQNQSASQETFYVGGATGLALTQGASGLTITNNYAHDVSVSGVFLSLSQS